VYARARARARVCVRKRPLTFATCTLLTNVSTSHRPSVRPLPDSHGSPDSLPPLSALLSPPLPTPSPSRLSGAVFGYADCCTAYAGNNNNAQGSGGFSWPRRETADVEKKGSKSKQVVRGGSNFGVDNGSRLALIGERCSRRNFDPEDTRILEYPRAACARTQ